MAGKTAQIGWQSYLGFLALISISLGILNLVPLPMLDGGQLMYDAWELLTGRKISVSLQELFQKIGVAGLMLLTMLALFNDISRLFLR
jgi:regulator of sigma E protease